MGKYQHQLSSAQPTAELQNQVGPDEVEGLLDGYVSPAELSEELGVSERTLSRWRALGVGPPVTRVGRRVLYSRRGARAWVDRAENSLRNEKAPSERGGADHG